MKLISISAILLLLNLTIFRVPLYIFSDISGIYILSNSLFLLLFSTLFIYFLVYKNRRLTHLKSTTTINYFLTIGSVILSVFFLFSWLATSSITEQIPMVYIIFVPPIGKTMLITGFLLLFLHNRKEKLFSNQFYQKAIVFITLIILFSQIGLIEHLSSNIIAFILYKMHYIEIGFPLIFLFNLMLSAFISFVIVMLFSIFSNILSKVYVSKYDVLMLFIGVVLYIIWSILKFNFLGNVSQDMYYQADETYRYLIVIFNIFFVIVIVRNFLAVSNDT